MKLVIIITMLLGISSRALGQGKITQALFPNENAHPQGIPLPPVNYLQPPVAKSLYKSEPYPPPPAPAYGLPPPDYYRVSYEKSSTVPEIPSYQPIPASPEEPLRHLTPPVPTWNDKIPIQPAVEFAPAHFVSPIAPNSNSVPILPLLPLPPMPMMGD